MAMITFENRQVWQDLFNEVAKEKPCIGRTVRITRGKHSAKIGKVIRHASDRYTNVFRYGNEASHAMTQARGRDGFIILVESQGETFWTKANYAMVCVE